MTHTLVHRGPDDFGFMLSEAGETITWKKERRKQTFEGPGVAFGHRRLSILDLSEAGHQPFSSPDLRYWMVYNGEVFNYRELREELTAAGELFTTQTDTEVVLRAFSRWGRDCFNRFNGMWAIVIWDTLSRTLTASRDRFGIKPLYFAEIKGDWIFASEAKAILSSPGFTATPDQHTLLDFVLGRHVLGKEQSFFADIKPLKPASIMTIKDGVAASNSYWRLPRTGACRFRSTGDAAEALRTLFTDAVDLRLRSDVRVGTMLSGGVDSTSVISTVQKLLNGSQNIRNVVGERISAFNASFPGLPIDEAQNVDTLCRTLDLAAHRVYPLECSALEIKEILNCTINHLEAPWHSAVPIVLTLLMRRARSEGINVVLNGHGGDELFGGYSKYLFNSLADMLSRFQPLSAYAHFEGIHRTLRLSRKQIMHTVAALLLDQTRKHRRDGPADDVFSLLQDDTRDWYRNLDERPYNLEIFGTSRLDTALRVDLFRHILPSWLYLEDRISMSESVEARLPFLDYRLVEFAFSLDERFKISRGITKVVLREAMADRLPHSIVADTRKFRFAGPEMQWLTGPLRSELEAVFLRDTPLLARWLKLDSLRKTVRTFLSEPTVGLPPRVSVWRLFNAELFLRRYFTGAPAA